MRDEELLRTAKAQFSGMLTPWVRACLDALAPEEGVTDGEFKTVVGDMFVGMFDKTSPSNISIRRRRNIGRIVAVAFNSVGRTPDETIREAEAKEIAAGITDWWFDSIIECGKFMVSGKSSVLVGRMLPRDIGDEARQAFDSRLAEIMVGFGVPESVAVEALDAMCDALSSREVYDEWSVNDKICIVFGLKANHGKRALLIRKK